MLASKQVIIRVDEMHELLQLLLLFIELFEAFYAFEKTSTTLAKVLNFRNEFNEELTLFARESNIALWVWKCNHRNSSLG